jgi:hypothetical protein
VIVTGWSASTSSDFLTVKYAYLSPPVVTAAQLTNGTVQLRVDEVLLDCTVVIEVSTNLDAWVPVFTNTKPTNVLLYTDPDAGSLPMRFYRAFQFH